MIFAIKASKHPNAVNTINIPVSDKETEHRTIKGLAQGHTVGSDRVNVGNLATEPIGLTLPCPFSNLGVSWM
jgi:hypothetical protein